MSKKILKFGATWCTSCKSLSKVFDELKLSETYDIEELDVDMSPFEASNHSVRGLPTVIVLDEGKEILRFVGAKTPAEVTKYLESV